MIRFARLAFCLATPALAQDQADIVQAGFLPGWQMANGHYMAALDLNLAPDWKTYWRAPGEAGIPPVFDWAGSTNLKSVQFHWPSPQVIALNGMKSIGYVDKLVLPVEVVAQDPTQPVTLALTMDLGICHDICMPAHLTFAAVLQGGGAKDSQIAAALADMPKQAKGATCKIEPITDGLRLRATLKLPALGPDETVVFETNDPQVWVAEAQTVRQEGVLTSTTDLVPSSGAPFTLDRSAVTMTVLAQGNAVEYRGCAAP
jgi:DsbC/DsbD-like thiol-disulfide interchange protein